MPEELAAGSINAIGAATEIHLVEVQLQNLPLGKFPLQRQRQDHLPDFPAPAIAVVEEDVARHLLGDSRCALPAAALAPVLQRNPRRARHANGIDPGMHVKTLVFGGHHRVHHDRGNLVIRQPAPETRPQGHDHAAISGMDADHLTIR